MSSHAYQPLPTSLPPSGLVNAEAEEFDRLPETVDTGETDGNNVNDDDRLTDPTSFRPLRESVESEFARPPPSWWKRLLLVLFVIFTGWAAVRLGSSQRKPKVIYASRYSEEHKYRPAASPVITEHLQDGRIRLRGASVGGVGVKEEDIPLTPVQKKEKERKRREEAREAAKLKMGLKVKRKSNRGRVGGEI